jgi:putative tricarboxylic transport membrane protein
VSGPPAHRLLARKNVLAGLMFIALAVLGLWVSRSYPVGTALRMGTGYMPRLLCWVLMGLGAVVLAQGLRGSDGGRVVGQATAVNPAVTGQVAAGGVAAQMESPLRLALAQLLPIAVVTASLVAFALTLEQLGLALAIGLLIGIGAVAARGIKLWEVAATAAGLIVLSWAIFIVGLGLPIPVWPDF